MLLRECLDFLWRRVTISSEEGHNVEVASDDVVQRMREAWTSDPLSHTKSIDQLQKASLLGPASVAQKREAEKKEIERKRKLEARQHKMAKDAKERERLAKEKEKEAAQRKAEEAAARAAADAAARAAVEGANQNPSPTKGDIGNNKRSRNMFETPLLSDTATVDLTSTTSAFGDDSHDFFNESTWTDRSQDRSSVLNNACKNSGEEKRSPESDEEMLRRIEKEEMAAIRAEKETLMRQQIRSRLRAELDDSSPNHTSASPYLGVPSDMRAGTQHVDTTQAVQRQPSSFSMPFPPPFVMHRNMTTYEDQQYLMLNIHDLKRKIARLEGEQRVLRVDHREGELEILRFDLENAQRALCRIHA